MTGAKVTKGTLRGNKARKVQVGSDLYVSRIMWLTADWGCEARTGSRRPGGGDDGLSQVGTVVKVRGVLFQVKPAGCAAG